MNSHNHALDRLLQECLPTILMSRPEQSQRETPLTRFSLSDYDEWRPQLPALFTQLVEERTNGAQTIRDGAHTLEIGRRLNRGTYLVRSAAADKLPALPLEVNKASTVLFEINPYRSLLVAGF
ncbi:MAG: hypothetical protein ACREGE_03095 [Candidatus Microsaccharimonas sp.]